MISKKFIFCGACLPFWQEPKQKKASENEVISAQEAEDLKMKEKRKREREV